ncbi:MAG TPA: DUF389 domain-containing protein [Micromonosporaceae bacterium]|nr:DUF389 domain-containing protein [Micromonosporaceae bacterium]
MLQLRVFGETDVLRGVNTWLETSGHGRHVVVVPQVHPIHSGLLMADVQRESVDDVVGHLSGVGVGQDNVSFINVDTVEPPSAGIRATSLIWTDMMGVARSNARPTARYLVLMVVAGVIAGYGVLTINDTLIIGAMAVSPDTYPIVSACVGVVGRRWRLIYRSVATLVIGLTATAATAAAVGGIVGESHRLGAFSATSPSLAGLVTIGVGTVGVALAAGVAAALSIETRASSAVGVAISVTTIPAAAYFGVAVAVHQHGKAGGALAVLGVNVAMLLVGGSVTLAVQRWLNRRAESRAAG